MARNFMPIWRRASFRGASFFVEMDKVETGRALVVHEFPHRDTPYVEDLGRVANKIQVTAYIASDNLEQETAALFSACGQRGPSTLVLPMERHQVHCESCARDWSRDRQGYIAFQLSFVKDGSGAAPYSAPYLSRLVNAAAADAVPALAQRFAAVFLTARQAGYVTAAAVTRVQDAAAQISAVRSALPVAAMKAPGIVRAIETLYRGAIAYADAGSVGDTWAESRFSPAPAPRPVPDLASDVAAILEPMRAATPPADFVREIAALLEFGAGVSAGPAPTPSRAVLAANTAVIDATVRGIALVQWAAAVGEMTLTDRRQAIGLRAEAAERFDAEISTLAGPEASRVFVALSEVRAQIVQYLTRALADLKPVIVAETNRSLPSLAWSQHLYGTAARAGELAERNRAIHASFMPLAIEALAP